MNSDARRTTHNAQRFLNSRGILFGVPAIFVLAYCYSRFVFLADIEICAVKRFLNIPCPGCGLTESFALLTCGNFGASFSAHPFGIVIALWFVYLFFNSLCLILSSRPLPDIFTQRQRDWLLGLFVVGMFVRWFIILTKGAL